MVTTGRHRPVPGPRKGSIRRRVSHRRRRGAGRRSSSPGHGDHAGVRSPAKVTRSGCLPRQAAPRHGLDVTGRSRVRDQVAVRQV
jgi:hypothetical protein